MKIMRDDIKRRIEMIDRGEVPQGYKKTKIGVIPSEWDEIQLKKIGKFINGKAFKPSDWDKEGLPIVRIQNLNGSNEFNYFNNEVDEKYIVKKGDLLFAWSGSRGSSFGPYLWNKYTGVLNQHIFKVELNDMIDKNYTFCIMEKITEDIENNAHGSAGLVHVTKSELEKFIIPYPNIEEQILISNILLTEERLIGLKASNIELKKIQRKGLIQTLLRQGIEKNSNKKTKAGTIPKQWKCVKAKEIFKSVSIKNNENEELLSVTQDKGVLPRTMLEGRVMMPEGNTNTYKLVEPNNYVISLRSFEGGIEMSNYRGLVSPAYTVLENIIDIDYDFYRYLFKTNDFISRLNRAVIGIRDGKQISYADFSELYLPLPSLEEQRKISEIVMTIDKEIELLEKELEKIKEQKKGLMQLLLTGKVRVKELEL